jgi:acetolactate synthase-1/2/3 large subunit
VRLTGGAALVRALVAEGVDTLFALPGIQNDWLFNALFDARDRVRVIHTRHEQGAAYMALGYALARGDIGAYSVVPGPGFLNTTAALSTAYALNAPVLCLAGQIPSAAIGRERGVLHQIPDQLGVLRSLTKWAARASSPAEVSWLAAQAFGELRSGRPRPVGLEVPMDVLADVGPVDEAYRSVEPRVPPTDAGLVDEAARLLAEASHPLIWVGSGAQGASEAIRRIAEHLQAPVAAYRTGRGVLDSRHHLSLVQPQAHPLWKDVDVVLAVGTQMRVPLLNWGVDARLRVIHVDVDPTSHDRIRPPAIAVTARSEDAVPQIADALVRRIGPRQSRRDGMAALAVQWSEARAFLQPQIAYLDVIREALGEHGVFVDELTQVGFSARVVMPVYHPRTFISTGYQGTLGYGFQTALGVKVARPDIPVVSVTGDGGFMFGVQELATAVQHRIGLVTVVFNNNQYGNVQQMQRAQYGGRVIASDLHNPDFVRLAESFGAVGLRAEGPDALGEALRAAAGSDRPAVIEVPCGEMPDVDRFRKLPRVRGEQVAS